MSRGKKRGNDEPELTVAGQLSADERLRFVNLERRRLEVENLKLRMELDHREEAYEGMRGIIPPPPKYRVKFQPVPSASNLPEVEAHFGAADWHIGAFSHPAQSSGRIMYSWELAHFGLLDIVNRWCRMLLADLCKYRIAKVHFWAAGDVVNGELRKSDIHSNEFPPNVQTICAGKLMSQAIGRIAAALPGVPIEIHAIPGNHDRIDEKPASNDAANRSHSLNVYYGAQTALSSLESVSLIIYQDTQPTIEYRPGAHCVVTHGHGVKMHRRIPYYGLRDLLTASVLEAIDYRGPTPDFLLVGHFHQYACLDDGRVILLPSLMGPTLYSRGAGYRGAPAQLVWYTGEHGPFGFTSMRRRLPVGFKVPEYVAPWDRAMLEDEKEAF